MFTAMVIFHTIICILLVISILMQSAKGEGLAGAFGGGGGLSGAVFGGRGAATFLSKATSILAVVFFVNCGILAFMSSDKTGGSTGTSAVTEQATNELERQQAAQQMFPEQGDTPEGLPGETGTELPVQPATEDGQ